jgi:hypothetical protein
MQDLDLTPLNSLSATDTKCGPACESLPSHSLFTLTPFAASETYYIQKTFAYLPYNVYNVKTLSKLSDYAVK